MVNIRRILYPTDFSESSEKAIAYAIDLAARFKAKLYVQHVVEEAFPTPYLAPAGRQTMCATYPQEVVRRLDQQLGVVMGAVGQGSGESALLGSTAPTAS